MSARFRIDSLQYAVGAFCLLAGLLMVLVPHRFLQPPAFAMLDPFLFWAGSLSLIGGILIVSVAAMLPPRRWVIAAHLSVGLSLLLVAAGYLMTRGWIGMVAFTVLGAGTLAAPWLTSPQSSVRPPSLRSSHLLAWLLALILLLSSAAMLVAPNEFDAPNFDLLRPWLPTVALLDLLGGVALFVVLLRPVRPRVFRAAHVVAGAGILAHVLLVTWPNGNLIGLASYAAAKEGIRGLSRVAAREWGKDKIRAAIMEDHENRRALLARFERSQRAARKDPWAERAAGRDARVGERHSRARRCDRRRLIRDVEEMQWSTSASS